MADLYLDDEALLSAGEALVAVSTVMVEGNTAAPIGEISSLSGIGSEVRLYLQGLQTARASLADAAKTASGEIAGVMGDSAALDSHMAEALYAGFAVKGTER